MVHLYTEHGTPLYRARLVARGFEAVGNNNNVHSPVAKLTTFRMLLATAMRKKMKVHQFNVKNAYLNADLDEEAYLEIPEFVHASRDK